jgi:CrcB protein
LKNVVLVFLGGGLGSVMRYLIAKYLPVIDSLPYTGTLLVNVVGCLLLGLATGYFMSEQQRPLLLFLGVGLCGGLTTFSTFSLELFKLGMKDILLTSLYLSASLVLGIIALMLGLLWGKQLGVS